MKLPLYQLDVFTNRVFGGNPAAVVVMDRWLDDATLHSIAAENNLSETAFVIPQGERARLRWFTPTVEVDLCGHATLAAAHVLFKEHFPNADYLSFETNSGELGVVQDSGRIYLDFPARPGEPAEIDEHLVKALGAEPVEAVNSRDLMVVLESEKAVRDFVPDHQAIEALDTFALVVTAPGKDVDFVSRFLPPAPVCRKIPLRGQHIARLSPIGRSVWASPSYRQHSCQHAKAS